MANYQNLDARGQIGARRGALARWAAILLVTMTALGAPLPVMADVVRESAEQRFAREAVRQLRASTFLVTRCERAFLSFWRHYTSKGPKGLIVDPTGNTEEPYFGYGNIEAAPLLEVAQDECEAETGARGDLVVRVLKERENKKWRRAQKLEHAERIIGY